METSLDELKKKDYPAYIARTKSLREILHDLRVGEAWLAVAAITAWLASVFMVVKFFVASDAHYSEWTDYQWSQAVIGMGITAIITMAQWFLYKTGKKGWAAIIATGVVIFFGLFSEISQTMEREDATVRSRSENSAVFQATLKAAGNLSNAPALSGAASSELARAQQKATQIQTRIDNKNRCNSCETPTFRTLRTMLSDAKGRVAAAQARADMEIKTLSASNAAALASTLTLAKDMEYDEGNHYAIMRFFKNFFDISFDFASFLFALIMIGTFEYAFHYVGGYVNDHRKALEILGRDSDGRRMNDVQLEDALDDENILRANLGLKQRKETGGELAQLHQQVTTPAPSQRPIPSEPPVRVRDTEDTPQDTDTPPYGEVLVQAILKGRITRLQKRMDGEVGQLLKSLNPGMTKKEGEPLINKLIVWLVSDMGLAMKQERKVVTDPEYVLINANANQGFTNKRFYKLIYTQVRNMILNGEVMPTVRPVTDVVTTILKEKGDKLGIKSTLIGKPQRQQIAQTILQQLEEETVVTRNQEGGVGKPKYMLAEKYLT